MRRSAFAYELPGELIAQVPAAERDQSRLLVLSRSGGGVADRRFADLPELLRGGDLLVLNDTRVIPARMYGRKPGGGRVEVLLERVLERGLMLAQVRSGQSLRPGSTILIENGVELEVRSRQGGFFVLAYCGEQPLLEMLEAAGHVPLPPYIRRPDRDTDRDRYQTVFARHPGAVAAPTAGLHFTQALLERLRAQGVQIGFLTLHVGAGTFQPVRSEKVEDHRMHSEWFEVTEALCYQVARTRQRGGRVIAAGTSSLRGLEAAVDGRSLRPVRGETDLFIYPGFRFQVVDALLTNFHLPESTLLMLVCAFAGTENVLCAYRHAVTQRYRFYSYGDAMFIA
ncbi:MAG: tRNA preQ1(34) S-adenosylmethionine ribosyltransferase-isomerase QueA [Gammaproteobacteria bacterium]|nr:tRNA preQ1(34) S-adenosylmethionine ribosyltransferase-isomerase QueA [Gammaproteobacteria bacterium]